MKQNTTPEQTAKLIELGFEKPNSIASVEPIYGMGGISVAKAYSIGELLSFLPEEIKVENHSEPAYLQMLYDEENVWEVGYTFYGNGMYIKRNTEFIDCLFQMCVKLKEEGVI